MTTSIPQRRIAAQRSGSETGLVRSRSLRALAVAARLERPRAVGDPITPYRRSGGPTPGGLSTDRPSPDDPSRSPDPSPGDLGTDDPSTPGPVTSRLEAGKRSHGTTGERVTEGTSARPRRSEGACDDCGRATA